MKAPIWRKENQLEAYIFMKCKENHKDAKVVQASKCHVELHPMR